jgi:hypothetical protein
VVLHKPILTIIGTLPALFELYLHGHPWKTKAALNQIKNASINTFDRGAPLTCGFFPPAG